MIRILSFQYFLDWRSLAMMREYVAANRSRLAK